MSPIINQQNNNVNSKELKIAFLGTPEFAVLILEKLAQSPYKPVAVFCAPDKPVGRKQILTPPPIKIVAQKYNIPVWQPANSHELVQQLKTINYQLIVSAAYGIILPKEILNTPKYGCLNIHPSLLPKYRGASPVQAAILNGDEETGVTIFKMTEKVDAGPIVAQKKLNLTVLASAAVPPWRDGGAKQSRPETTSHGIATSRLGGTRNDKLTTPELSEILSYLSADLLLEILPDWLAGKIQPKPQDNSRATYTKTIKKEDGLINWQKSAQEIKRQIRAYQPWPGAFTKLKMKNARSASLGEAGEKLKIIEADILEKNTSKKIGEVFLIDNNELAVQTGEDALIIKKLQREGGKPMAAAEFLRGHRDIVGKILN